MLLKKITNLLILDNECSCQFKQKNVQWITCVFGHKPCVLLNTVQKSVNKLKST